MSNASNYNRHKYAPVSGSVESTDASTLQTAWREFQEETSLDSSSIRLFRQGKPYTFSDESIGREWTINPFAFVLRDAAAAEGAIKLDWEHESYNWFDIDELLNGDEHSIGGVPKLLESLRRVWFEVDLGQPAGGMLSAGLKALQEDHESGARVLATKALAVYKEVITNLDSSDGERWWCNVRLVGWHLWKNGRESMGASVLSVVLSTLAILEKHMSGSSSSVSPKQVQKIVNDIEEFEAQRADSSAKIGDEFASFTSTNFPISAEDNQNPLRILTLSCSSTITRCLNALTSESPRPLDIRILESRPLYEGVTMARQITPPKNSLSKTSIYTDASAAIAARDVDLLLIGADLIDAAGNVSNKTGSLPAVLSTRHVAPAAKVIAVAEREKVLPFEPPAHDEENDPKEVFGGWGNVGAAAAGCVDVKNVYFEWVPASMVHHYVTEDGVLASNNVEKWAEDARDRAREFFDGI
jgi:translation initiation factor 2B subunit (eIF-2B alpha/beta/delta family)/ADP-ribose pyrophosphatase YjhB (NUDIX family)